MKIFIDPGHNFRGADSGAEGYGLKEQEVTFYIAEHLRDMLVSAGHEVKMSRDNLTACLGRSEQESLAIRAKMANDWGADLFISIHCNSSKDGKGYGTEAFVVKRESVAGEYAEQIQNSIVKKLGTYDRDVKEYPWYVLKHTNMPAVLVETAFINHPGDNELLRSRQAEFASAICDGILGLDELTEINDIVWEYAHRGLVTDADGMLHEMRKEPNGRLYWLARKALHYMRRRDI